MTAAFVNPFSEVEARAKKARFLSLVGARILAVREAAGLSVQKLANEIGVSKSTIESAENGYSCSAYLLARIAEALDCTLDDLCPLDATK